MKTITDASDEELSAELKRRSDERKREADLLHDKHTDLVRTCITLQVVNALAPLHNCRTCTDDKPINGWGQGHGGGPRCTRCGLLEISREQEIPWPGWWLVAHFEERKS